MDRLKNLNRTVLRLAHLGGERFEFSLLQARNMNSRRHISYFNVSTAKLLTVPNFDRLRRRRNMPRTPRSKLFLLVALMLSLTGSGCQRMAERLTTGDSDAVKPSASAIPAIDSLPYGNPSNATADPQNEDNYLVIRDSHVLSYNNSRGTANWVAWKTTRADLGDSIPRPQFQPDRSLPDGFRKIAYYDYSGSGYDRGHMLPSADRFGNKHLNEQTFLMTNIVPQTSALNQFPWEQLESYARSLARKGNAIYTIAGVYGEKEWLRNRVTAPTNCWKIIAVIPPGRDTIDANTRVIAVDMPNLGGIERTTWQKYRTSVRLIEEKTGYDLFRTLPRDIQDAIEVTIDRK